MTERELDEILTLDWPRVIQRATQAGDAWAKGFALSIRRQAKRPEWRPSPRQAALMRKMVDEARSRAAGDDGEVLE